MKILYYNWDPLLGPAGGGVTGYLGELIRRILERHPEIEIWFLNSGRKYTESGELSIQRTENPFGERVKSYEVVNSPVLAAGKQSPVNFKYYLEESDLARLFVDFVIASGGFDVVHFHNIEGISLGVLKAKEYFPETKWLLSLHNYFPFCAAVTKWRECGELCKVSDFTECNGCYTYENYDLARFRFKHIDIPGLRDIFRDYSKKNPELGEADIYARFYDETREAINKCMDAVLCVSKRTLEIAEAAGIMKNILKLSYAGSGIAERQQAPHGPSDPSEPLRAIYLGYAQKEKGFDFLLDAFEEMSEEAARKVKLTVLCRHDSATDERIREKLDANKFLAGYTVINGYKDEEELQGILKDQDLGLVPVLWEDNLPRVAMEMFACGIPLLTSNLGGAKELGGENYDFVFEAGNSKDFEEKLKCLACDREKLSEYWKGAIKLRTMDDHINELLNFYQE